jgi:hypothetical protein
LAFIDGKQHKLGSVPSEATARRIADVARHALATVFDKPQDNPVFPGEFAASACTVANYALGYTRSRGRPNKSAGRAAGQATKVHAITSGEVVARIGELVGKPAPTLPEGDQLSGAYRGPLFETDQLHRAGDLLAAALLTAKADQPAPQWTPTVAPDSREVAEEAASDEIRAWFRLQRDLYRVADLLNAEAEQMLRREAGRHYRVRTGQGLAPEVVGAWAAEQDATADRVSPMPGLPPWFHSYFGDGKPT